MNDFEMREGEINEEDIKMLKEMARHVPPPDDYDAPPVILYQGADVFDQAKVLADKGTPMVVPVRRLLQWVNAGRRGVWVNKEIQDQLAARGLITDPDFVGAWIDAPVRIVLPPAESNTPEIEDGSNTASDNATVDRIVDVADNGVAEEVVETISFVTGAVSDPTYRVGRLAAANNPNIVKVAPDDPLSKAITLMLLHDYSQLPVVSGANTVKGVISWQSIGRSRIYSLPSEPKVQECMGDAHEISPDISLFSIIDAVSREGHAIVRAKDKSLSGIITVSDLGEQLSILGEPFILLGEIENHVRKLIDGKFSPEVLQASMLDGSKPVASVADLTFGAYHSLLSKPENWTVLGIDIDRVAFTAELERVREIRNTVMHFDPDGITESDRYTLQNFVRFLRGMKI